MKPVLTKSDSRVGSSCADKAFDGKPDEPEPRWTVIANPVTQKDIDSVLVYASSPVPRVIGEFQIEGIIPGLLDLIRKVTTQSREYGTGSVSVNTKSVKWKGRLSASI